jgi:hypothetical protein
VTDGHAGARSLVGAATSSPLRGPRRPQDGGGARRGSRVEVSNRTVSDDAPPEACD